MAGDIVDDLETLSAETKRSLLNMIKDKTTKPASDVDVAFLAYAYAMVEGARLGVLPGAAPRPKPGS